MQVDKSIEVGILEATHKGTDKEREIHQWRLPKNRKTSAYHT